MQFSPYCCFFRQEKLASTKFVLWCSHCKIHRFVAAPFTSFLFYAYKTKGNILICWTVSNSPRIKYLGKSLVVPPKVLQNLTKYTRKLDQIPSCCQRIDQYFNLLGEIWRCVVNCVVCTYTGPPISNVCRTENKWIACKRKNVL